MLHGLEKFVRFSNDMDRKFPGYGFKPFIQKLGNLKSIMQSASGPCFSIDQIHLVKILSIVILVIKAFCPGYRNSGTYDKLLLIRERQKKLFYGGLIKKAHHKITLVQYETVLKELFRLQTQQIPS
jgi:hypothetical protein